MAPEIDRSSFVLGELTGKLDQMDRKQEAIFEKLEKIEKSITHMKVKNAGQSASIAIIISLVIAFFSKALKWH